MHRITFDVLLCVVVLVLLLLIGYLTLIERFFLAGTQLRHGPERFMLGMLSPLLDGIKLFGKYDAMLSRCVVLLVCPVGLMLILCINYVGMCMACGDSFVNIDMSMLFLVTVLGVISFFFFFVG